MVTDEARLLKELIRREERLLENSVRNDPAKIGALVDARCLFVSASGARGALEPGEPFDSLQGVSYIDSNTVELLELSEECRMLVYVAATVSKNTRAKSRCSSVWKRDSGDWKIVFHQETTIQE
ncbi:MAG TPA: hypothetical protein PLH55_12635 [Spirochaetales bacterium]|nr:hypothetical protein [Spirochaetales bacterium]